MKPRLLDLFCGAGGAAIGYHRAGFDVVGVDINPQPNYPFKMTKCDAMIAMHRLLHEEWLATRFGRIQLSDFSAIHASPPCQHFTRYGNVVKDIKDRYDDFLGPTRDLLNETGLPWVIENVEGSPLIEPVMLCGSMFAECHDLRRHRLFETNWGLNLGLLPQCNHGSWEKNRYPGGRWKARKENDSSITPSSPIRNTIEVGRWNIKLEKQKWAMGVDWKMTLRELSESIPPSYTHWVGEHLLAHVRETASA